MDALLMNFISYKEVKMTKLLCQWGGGVTFFLNHVKMSIINDKFSFQKGLMENE